MLLLLCGADAMAQGRLTDKSSRLLDECRNLIPVLSIEGGREITDAEISEMVRKCSNGGTTTTGAFKVLAAADMEKIYRMAK